MADRRRRRQIAPVEYTLAGHHVFTLSYTDVGTVVVPRPGRHRLCPADREEAADWLARNMVPARTQDEAYTLLFANSPQG